MNIELSILEDGGVLMVSDSPMPDVVKRIEFYRDQKLMMLIYQNETTHEDTLMHYEVPDKMLLPIEKSPDIVLYTMFHDHPPIGYKVPLIKVGGIA